MTERNKEISRMLIRSEIYLKTTTDLSEETIRAKMKETEYYNTIISNDYTLIIDMILCTEVIKLVGLKYDHNQESDRWVY